MAWARNPFDHVLGREMDSGLDACASPRNDDGETMQSVRLRENRLARRAIVPQRQSLISPPNQWLPLTRLVPEKRGGSRSSRTLGTGCDGRDSVRRAGQMARGRMTLTRTA